MEKQTKITYLLILTFFVSVIIHNFFYAIFGKEDVIFFFLAMGSFLVFFLSIFYNFFTYRKKGVPKDIWKLGFLGLIGLLGMLPGFNTRLFGFFGFFGFFGSKRND
ncbi:MAG: hypothetical protein P8Y06_00610 [Patescibacteria group bacterium]